MSRKTFRLFNEPTRIYKAAVRAALLAGSVIAAAGSAFAQDIVVKYDQATLLRLPRPAVEIIIGNPSIADVVIQNGSSLVVTGKSFGVTNLIAIDAQGQVIKDQRLMVRRDEERVVNVHRGTARQTYNCTPNCQPMLTIGDDSEFYSKVEAHMKTKFKISEGAGDPGSGN